MFNSSNIVCIQMSMVDDESDDQYDTPQNRN